MRAPTGWRVRNARHERVGIAQYTPARDTHIQNKTTDTPRPKYLRRVVRQPSEGHVLSFPPSVVVSTECQGERARACVCVCGRHVRVMCCIPVCQSVLLWNSGILQLQLTVFFLFVFFLLHPYLSSAAPRGELFYIKFKLHLHKVNKSQRLSLRR